MAKMIEYHLAKYGEELMVEGVGLDAHKVEVIKAALPPDVQAKIFGWRNLGMLPYTKGEKFISHALDGTLTGDLVEVGAQHEGQEVTHA